MIYGCMDCIYVYNIYVYERRINTEQVKISPGTGVYLATKHAWFNCDTSGLHELV